jgi:hypothetical protein
LNATPEQVGMLEAIALAQPCSRLPEFPGIASERQLALLKDLYQSGWIDQHVFIGDGSLPEGNVLRLTEKGEAALQDAVDRRDAASMGGEETSVEEKRQRRSMVLGTLYELTDGSSKVAIPVVKIAEVLGWDEPKVRLTMSNLVDREYVRRVSFTTVTITASGVEAAEEAITAGSEGTDDLAPMTITTGDHSVVQVVGRGSAHNQASLPAATNPVHRPWWRRMLASGWPKIIAPALAILLAAGIVAAFHELGKATGGSNGIVEYADNRMGSPVFKDPAGHAVTGLPGSIPFNTRVDVECKVVNTSGRLPSVTAFYVISSGQWRGNYVVSDTMSNGGPPGNTTSPAVDPRVPNC